jgi:hypothetical protein
VVADTFPRRALPGGNPGVSVGCSGQRPESAPVASAEAGVDLAGALIDGYAEPARDCGLMSASTDVVCCALQSRGQQHHHAGQEAARWHRDDRMLVGVLGRPQTGRRLEVPPQQGQVGGGQQILAAVA